ncbi:hypothetical protein CBL_07059 [Carabus blaptoides fortunei]
MVKKQFHGPSGLTNSITGRRAMLGVSSARVKRVFILVRLAGRALYRYGVILEATNDGFQWLGMVTAVRISRETSSTTDAGIFLLQIEVRATRYGLKSQSDAAGSPLSRYNHAL